MPRIFARVPWIALCLVAVSVRAQFVGERILIDGPNSVAESERKVGNEDEVQREPLFENVPFLRLRKGDTLVKGWAAETGSGFFLRSGGKYFALPVIESPKGLLQLEQGTYTPLSILFDWDFDLAHATFLRRFTGFYENWIPPKLGENILQAIEKDFPEALPRFSFSEWSLKPDKMVSIPGHEYYEFQGLISDLSGANRIYRYTLRIGPGVYSVSGRLLVNGPPSLWELSDPLTPKQKQAVEAKDKRFQEMIERLKREYFVDTPPPPPVPFYVARGLDYHLPPVKPVARVRSSEPWLDCGGTGQTAYDIFFSQFHSETYAPHPVAMYSRATNSIIVVGNWAAHAFFWAKWAEIAGSKPAIETGKPAKPRKPSRKK